jgi:NADH:ubiquinone oxidoreductase subunit 5 (subunit L)/multisubunit Na+/H+ antiporter MnhA subunit
VAGVYLVARMLPVFLIAPYVRETLFVIATLTALLGALVALTQTDIKKVVAYSTISNLGFMMLALAAGSVTAAMLHLMTHAFFKACLFLGAGSIIHSTGHQEMDQLGGLRKYMPITFWTFFIAALANAGVPPLAGFWSKDEVLHALQDNPAYFVIMIGWVFISGVYTARMLYLTFWGEYRGLAPVTVSEGADVASQALHHAPVAPPVTAAAAAGLMHEQNPAVGTGVDHGGSAHVGVMAHAADDAHGGGHGHGGGIPHESPASMTIPLILLAILAIVSGFVVFTNIGEAIGLPGGFGAFVHEAGHPEEFSFNWALAATGTLAGLAGIFFGLYMVMKPSRIRRFVTAVPDLFNLVNNKFYFDSLYQAMIDYVFLAGARLISWFYSKIINETSVDGPSFLTRWAGARLKYLQSGRLPNYAMMIVAGLIVLAVVAYTTRT